MQGNPNGTPTEMLGVTSTAPPLLADAGNGDNSSIVTGGIQIRRPQSHAVWPDRRRSWRAGAIASWARTPGYDTTKWDSSVPAWNSGDTTRERICGNPLTRRVQKGGCGELPRGRMSTLRMSTTTTLAKLNGQSTGDGRHLRQLQRSEQQAGDPSTGLPHCGRHDARPTPPSSPATAATRRSTARPCPPERFATGQGVKCFARWTHSTTSTAVTYKWTLGSTTVAYGSLTSSSQNFDSDIEIYTISSLTSQIINVSPIIGGTSILAGPSNNNTGSGEPGQRRHHQVHLQHAQHRLGQRAQPFTARPSSDGLLRVPRSSRPLAGRAARQPGKLPAPSLDWSSRPRASARAEGSAVCRNRQVVLGTCQHRAPRIFSSLALRGGIRKPTASAVGVRQFVRQVLGDGTSPRRPSGRPRSNLPHCGIGR